MQTRDSALEPKGYQQLAVGAAAVALTVPDGARFAILKLNDANTVRWRDDGVDPTATVGMLVDQGDELYYTGKLQVIRFIRAGASDGTLLISYYA